MNDLLGSSTNDFYLLWVIMNVKLKPSLKKYSFIITKIPSQITDAGKILALKEIN